MGERPLFMDPQHVVRFDMPKVGPLATDRYTVLRADKCPDTPVPPEPGWWQWKRGEWLPLTGGQAIEEIPGLIRPALPKVKTPGDRAEETPWLCRRYGDEPRLMLLVGDRPVPVDADAWDGWVGYLDAAIGLGAWQARQTGRNRPVTFWHGKTWLGLLLPVLDKYLPPSLPHFDFTGEAE